MKVDASIVINRPVEAVWAYMSDFANATVINPVAREQLANAKAALEAQG